MTLLTKTGRKLAWLAGEIAKRRDRAAKLARRLEAVELGHGGDAPGFRRKFLKYLREIADEREGEMRLLSRVEAIEKRHSDMRLRGRLAYARQRRFPRDNPYLRAVAKDIREEDRAARRAKKADDLLLLLLVMWYFLAQRWRLFSSEPTPPSPR